MHVHAARRAGHDVLEQVAKLCGQHLHLVCLLVQVEVIVNVHDGLEHEFVGLPQRQIERQSLLILTDKGKAKDGVEVFEKNNALTT